MSQLEFTIGSQWRTRGGWRAVVVSVDNNGGLVVWHERDYTRYQLKDGRFHGLSDNSHDLIEKWKEPRTGELFVNVYDDIDEITGIGLSTLDAAKENTAACISIGRTLIARVHVPKWTEGEGL